MKKLLFITLAAVGMMAYAEYTTLQLNETPVKYAQNAKVVGIDVISTVNNSAVAVKVVRPIQSYTNCMSVVVFTNGIGEVSTITNRWKGLKANLARTNTLASVTCTNGLARLALDNFILGGDTIITTGLTNLNETVKAKLIIKK